jgi:phosphatidylglycerophosphate synthase
VPSRTDYFARWSELHGGYDPSASRLVGPWLSLVYVCARPLAVQRVPPDLVTALGVVAAAGVAGAGRAGGWWLYAGVLLVVLSGLLDGLDGAVAVLSGRTSALGYVLDSVADRCSDLLYLVALWWVGAPAGACVAGGVLMLLQEYLRARAAAGGMTEVGVVTVWERPSRVLVTGAFLLGAAIYRSYSPGASAGWATYGAWAWVALGVAGFLQLTVVVGRRLR